MVDISVKTLIRYNPTYGMDKNSNEWRAIHIKKIIKNEELNRASRFDWIYLDGVKRQVTAANTAVFLNDLLQAFTKKIINDHGNDIVIVPVPNSEAVSGFQGQYRTLELAQMIASHSNGSITLLDALRWKENKGSSHRNQKPRNCDSHISNLNVIARTNRNVVLFDDVITSGSQLAASKIKLEEKAFNIAGFYAVFNVLDTGIRGSDPRWITINKRVQTFNDFLGFPLAFQPKKVNIFG